MYDVVFNIKGRYMKSDVKYVMVTAISSFRQRYCIPMDQLQELNPTVPVEAQWALDCVTCEEVEEFSQSFIGEHIIDHEVLTLDQVLERFDKENAYLDTWKEGEKIEYINNRWKTRQ